MSRNTGTPTTTGHRLGGFSGPAIRTVVLEKKIGKLRSSLAHAKTALSSLETEANQTIGEELTRLYEALQAPKTTLALILAEHQQQVPTNALTPEHPPQVNILPSSLEKLVDDLKGASERAESSTLLSEKSLERAIEYNRDHRKTVDASFKSIEKSILDVRGIVEGNVTRTEKLAQSTANSSKALLPQITVKQGEIFSSQTDLANKQKEVREAQREKEVAREKMEAELKEAKELRSKAKRNGVIAVGITIGTMGLAAPAAAVLAVDAYEKGKSAEQATKRADTLSQKLNGIEKTTREVECRCSSLQAEMGQLESAKQEMEADLVRHSARKDTLDIQLRDLHEEEALVEAFDSEVTTLDTASQKLLATSKAFHDQLVPLTSSLSNLACDVRKQQSAADNSRRRNSNTQMPPRLRAAIIDRLTGIRTGVDGLVLAVEGTRHKLLSS